MRWPGWDVPLFLLVCLSLRLSLLRDDLQRALSSQAFRLNRFFFPAPRCASPRVFRNVTESLDGRKYFMSMRPL